MSNNIAIKAENLSKAYQLGEIGTGTISRDLERWYARLRGKEDPFLRIGETNDRTGKGSSDIVWSLKDINFEIEQGDAVGIIGRNGAGKSTLLKVLSRVTSPTSGRITGKGRIASLLEVGTGFHPELTGRENIYLNGAILGMRKKEITRKFDEIVDFAGVERYIDTPVKRYSSGMYVRLAFAVAAHLESEILIVDEVLAVGDAEFQKKCLGKMGDVSKGEGRTVLFVSHNMASVRTLCTKGILLKNGQLEIEADINTVVDEYIQGGLSRTNYLTWSEENFLGNNLIKIKSLKISTPTEQELTIESGLKLEVTFLNYKENINLAVSIFISTTDNILLFECSAIVSKTYDSKKGEYILNISVPPFTLNAGLYKASIIFGENQRIVLFHHDEIITFEVEETFHGRGVNREKVPGLMRPLTNYHLQYTNDVT